MFKVEKKIASDSLQYHETLHPSNTEVIQHFYKNPLNARPIKLVWRNLLYCTLNVVVR